MLSYGSYPGGYYSSQPAAPAAPAAVPAYGTAAAGYGAQYPPVAPPGGAEQGYPAYSTAQAPSYGK